jgi:hypothetical protein
VVVVVGKRGWREKKKKAHEISLLNSFNDFVGVCCR